MGILYLVQPAELVGTNRYKIGCSNKSTLERVKKGYKNGTRYLHIMECDDAMKIEKMIKKDFHKTFILIAGTEYFEGDEDEMKKVFYEKYTYYSSKINIKPKRKATEKQLLSIKKGSEIKKNKDIRTKIENREVNEKKEYDEFMKHKHEYNLNISSWHIESDFYPGSELVRKCIKDINGRTPQQYNKEKQEEMMKFYEEQLFGK